MLIVNFKAYALLRRCLASVVPVLTSVDDVIVVDQESDARLIDPIVQAFPGITVIRLTGNIGFAAGVNLAARQTRADHLLLLNPDAAFEGDALASLRHVLQGDATVGVVGPRVINEDGTIQASARRFPDLTTGFGGRTSWLTDRFPGNWLAERNLLGREAQRPMRVDWVSGACLLTRRDLFEQLDGMDEGFFLYWEDADYCRRALTAGFSTVYVPDAVVRHRVAASSSQNFAQAIRAFHASALRMYRKHAGPFGQWLTPAVQLALLARQWLRLRQAASLSTSELADQHQPSTSAVTVSRHEPARVERVLG